VPTILGMNYQWVSVAEKLPKGGYIDDAGTPTALGVARALRRDPRSHGL
jgi:hypothetical protein